MNGRSWLVALPDELAPQRRVIARLLDFCEATPAAASFSVGCSLGRGAADALSDIDAALGVSAETPVRAIEAQVADTLASAGPLVDLLRYAGQHDDGVRRIFAQFADRTQVDLAIVPQEKVRLADRPDFVLLYPAAGSGDTSDTAYSLSSEQIREWTFHGWIGLLDMDKYLRRGSLWEAHERLHQVRHRIWALWAAATGAMYPWHGLSQVLDRDPHDLPPGIEATVATLDAAELRRAARASCALLAMVSEAAARNNHASLPAAMADYVINELG